MYYFNGQKTGSVYLKVNILPFQTNTPLNSEYKINNSVIKITSAKYLGVTITQNLSWKDHITKITNKANSTHGFLQHNSRQCSTNVKSLAYTTYVRPIVEYALVVWSPHTQSQKNIPSRNGAT